MSVEKWNPKLEFGIEAVDENNNCVATWRLGAQDILELPLLTASSKMETAPMAGKTWQTN